MQLPNTSLYMLRVFLKTKSIKLQKIRKYTTVKKAIRIFSFITSAFYHRISEFCFAFLILHTQTIQYEKVLKYNKFLRIKRKNY